MVKKHRGREEFMREAERLYDEMISRAGPQSGDTFDEIEEQAEGAGRKLILKLLKERLAAEAARQPEGVTCPGCGRPMRQPEKDRPRNLDTASGTVSYERRHAICDRCGESFSPSGRPVANSPSRGVGEASEKGVRGQSSRVVRGGVPTAEIAGAT